MSDFRTLKGLFIKHVSSDPSNLGAGDIWYNTSTQTLKVATSIGAWASGGNLGTARYQLSGCGTQTAGLAYGGYSSPPAVRHALTEHYDGSAWTDGEAMSSARSQLSGQHVGSQTAALSIGGNSPAGNYGALCEEYDGTDWAATDPLTTARSYLAGFGIQTAAVAAGGSTSPATAVTEEYNGTSWANGEDMVGTARYGATGTGTLTAGLAVGGYHSHALVEEYDGTDWTAVTAIPAAKHGVFGGMGTQTNCLLAGGSSGSPSTKISVCNTYDGTNWAASPALATARAMGSSGGTSTLAFAAGGNATGATGTNATEEFTGAATARSVDTT